MKSALLYNGVTISPPPQSEAEEQALLLRHEAYVKIYGFSPGFLVVSTPKHKQRIPPTLTDVKVAFVRNNEKESTSSKPHK